MHCGLGNTGLRVSLRQAAISLTGFIFVFFAFAFQMLNKVSGDSCGLCPPPRKRQGGGAHRLLPFHRDVATPCAVQQRRAGAQWGQPPSAPVSGAEVKLRNWWGMDGGGAD